MNDAGGDPPLRLDRAFESNHSTTTTKAIERQPVVFVLGTHGSGISLCSRILSTLGINMVDRIPRSDAGAPAAPGDPAPDNSGAVSRLGNIAELHDRILTLFNCGCHTPFHDFALPANWWVDARVARIRREVASILKEAVGDPPLGFGDPQMVRLMPIWQLIAADLKLAPKLVLCLRDPTEMVRSPQGNDGLGPDTFDYRLVTYITDFFRYVGSLDFCVVEYETWFNRPWVNVEKLAKLLNLECQPHAGDLDLALSAILAPELYHDEFERGGGRSLVRFLYRLAAHADQDPVARENVDTITAQFVDFQHLLRPSLRGFEVASRAAAANLSRSEREAAGLREAMAEREAALNAANEKAAAIEAQLMQAVAQIAAQQARLTDIAAERDAGTAALQQAKAEAAGLRAAVAEREAVLGAANEKAAAVEARLMQSVAEIAAQQTRLTDIAAERDAGIAALQQAEVVAAGLRAAVTQRGAALDAANEKAAAIEARLMQSVAEIAAQQARLTDIAAERDAGTVALQQTEVEAAGLRAAMAERGAALDAANKKAASSEAWLTQALAEIAVQQSRLTHIVAERDTGTVALQQAEVIAAGLRAEITERGAALDAANGKVAAIEARLVQALAEFERESSDWTAARARADDELRRRIADGKALRAEIAALSDQVAAARRVRDATADALRMYASAPPPKAPEIGRWKRIVTGLWTIINAPIRFRPARREMTWARLDRPGGPISRSEADPGYPNR